MDSRWPGPPVSDNTFFTIRKSSNGPSKPSRRGRARHSSRSDRGGERLPIPCSRAPAPWTPSRSIAPWQGVSGRGPDFGCTSATPFDGRSRISQGMGNGFGSRATCPYYLSTPLLFRLLQRAGCIEDMHFMLQREVAERITAAPGASAYGRLGLMVRCHARAEALFEAPPEAFRPPPRVWSAFVRLRPHRPSPIRDVAGFRRLVTRAFSHRRKRLGNALRGPARRGDDPCPRCRPRPPPGDPLLRGVRRNSQALRRPPGAAASSRKRGRMPFQRTSAAGPRGEVQITPRARRSRSSSGP